MKVIRIFVFPFFVIFFVISFFSGKFFSAVLAKSVLKNQKNIKEEEVKILKEMSDIYTIPLLKRELKYFWQILGNKLLMNEFMTREVKFPKDEDE